MTITSRLEIMTTSIRPSTMSMISCSPKDRVWVTRCHNSFRKSRTYTPWATIRPR
ncbi:Uncharacterised protein [Bordetella pertussis]|nr:Uncharacterised protein [Bordetella pertussis]CFO69874.1 Uncharacterised protein [Bordetella pertussis]CPH91556.1 Uncharacterised protein [Bordetella pertussis]CPK91607.1 Uncharacterised protein [Bordetella pertussis]CPL83857.1 Uncharacterised protein [Bordetella pertussis]